MKTGIWVKGIRSDEMVLCYNIIVFFCIFATIALVTDGEHILFITVYSGIIIENVLLFLKEN